MKNNICLCFLATQQFYEIRKGVLIQIHASARRVSKSDMQAAFSGKCLLQFISKIARYMLGS